MYNRLIKVLLLATAMVSFTAGYAQDQTAIAVKTVVIDAGHGGHDPGTIYGSVKEKDINLAVALELGRRIKDGFPNVNVIYTRKTDVFVPLVGRSSIANNAKADLFISVHVNSAGKSTSAYGTETFIMGTDKSNSNMELCKRENSVITLESDYTTTYAGYNPDDVDSYIFFNLMQSAQFEQSIYMASLVEEKFSGTGPIRHTRGIKQAPLLVLWQTTMPSVLVEVGFLSNPSDRQVLTSEASRNKIAGCIYSAFADYKKHYDPDDSEVISVADSPTTDVAPVEKKSAPAKVDPKDIVFRIQILASKTKIPTGAPELHGETEFDCVEYNGYYKYVVGSYKSRQDASAALTECRKSFPDAFIVRMSRDGKFVK